MGHRFGAIMERAERLGKLFHSVETFFPLCGKRAKHFSIVWKSRRAASPRIGGGGGQGAGRGRYFGWTQPLPVRNLVRMNFRSCSESKGSIWGGISPPSKSVVESSGMK